MPLVLLLESTPTAILKSTNRLVFVEVTDSLTCHSLVFSRLSGVMHNAECRIPFTEARGQELLRFQTLFSYLIHLLLS